MLHLCFICYSKSLSLSSACVVVIRIYLSPMIWFDDKGDGCAVWGVVSADRSVDEAKSCFSVAGDSAASMLWPSMGLSLSVSTELDESKPTYTLLGDLLKSGVFGDISRNVSVMCLEAKKKLRFAIVTLALTQLKTLF